MLKSKRENSLIAATIKKNVKEKVVKSSINQFRFVFKYPQKAKIVNNY